MATKTGIVTINGIQAIECDSDPSIGGLVAAIGSYASATDGSGIFYKSASSNTAWTQVIMPSTIPTRITNLENNEYKVTYYEIISGASGSVTLPTGATINAGEFGLSGNCILSKIDGLNKPTFESPKTVGGVVVTSSLNVSTGAWVASGVYTDTNVALIYSIKIKAVNYSNLNYANIIETVELTDFPISQTITNGVTDKVPSEDAVFDALALKLTQNNFTDITGSCTIVGWASYTTNSIRAVDMGDYYIVTGYIVGTSNNITTTVQMPYTNNGHRQCYSGFGVNNGTSVFTRVLINGASDTIDFRTGAAGNAWLATGTKEITFNLIIEK